MISRRSCISTMVPVGLFGCIKGSRMNFTFVPGCRSFRFIGFAPCVVSSNGKFLFAGKVIQYLCVYGHWSCLMPIFVELIWIIVPVIL